MSYPKPNNDDIQIIPTIFDRMVADRLTRIAPRVPIGLTLRSVFFGGNATFPLVNPANQPDVFTPNRIVRIGGAMVGTCGLSPRKHVYAVAGTFSDQESRTLPNGMHYRVMVENVVTMPKRPNAAPIVMNGDQLRPTRRDWHTAQDGGRVTYLAPAMGTPVRTLDNIEADLFLTGMRGALEDLYYINRGHGPRVP